MATGSQSCRVYVGNIDWRISWQDLKDHMRTAGDVLFADILEEWNGRSKGAAIVEYRAPGEARNAIAKLSDTMLGERLIFVREDREVVRTKGGSKGSFVGTKGLSYGGKKGYKGGGGSYGYDVGCGGGKGGGGFGGAKGGGGGFGGKGVASKGGKGGFGGGSSGTPLRVGPQDRGRLVYVGNLPFRAAWQNVKDLFKQHGNVIHVDIAQDVDGRSKGYGTVLFEKAEEAEAAIEALNENDFDGRNMMVRLDNFV